MTEDDHYDRRTDGLKRRVLCDLSLLWILESWLFSFRSTLFHLLIASPVHCNTAWLVDHVCSSQPGIVFIYPLLTALLRWYVVFATYPRVSSSKQQKHSRQPPGLWLSSMPMISITGPSYSQSVWAADYASLYLSHLTESGTLMRVALIK